MAPISISSSGSGTTSSLRTRLATISGNTVGSSAAHDGYGGGLETGPSSSLDVIDTTIAGNHVTGPKGHGGGIYAAGGSITSSIIAANTAADHGNCLASLTSHGHNLESANTCGLDAAGDVTNADPGLAPLGNYGGALPVQALLPGSKAANAAGVCTSATDERGVSRPQGTACDIGAVEALLPAPVTLAPTNLTPSSATLSAALGALPDPVTTTFETGVTQAYGTSLPGLATPASGTLTLSVTGPIKNLVRHTIYHARLDATTAAGTVKGNDVAFTTPAPIATVSKFTVTPTTFRPLAAARAASRRRPQLPAGTRFHFRASDVGAAGVVITHTASGRRSGRSCVKPTRKLRHHGPCTRTITDGTVRFRVAKAGTVDFPFSGRVGKHALGAASYRATLTLSRTRRRRRASRRRQRSACGRRRRDRRGGAGGLVVDKRGGRRPLAGRSAGLDHRVMASHQAADEHRRGRGEARERAPLNVNGARGQHAVRRGVGHEPDGDERPAQPAERRACPARRRRRNADTVAERSGGRDHDQPHEPGQDRDQDVVALEDLPRVDRYRRREHLGGRAELLRKRWRQHAVGLRTDSPHDGGDVDRVPRRPQRGERSGCARERYQVPRTQATLLHGA